MTQRETFIEDLHGMETVLCAIEDNCREQCLTEKQVIRAMARAIWHILGWMVKEIERRSK